MTKEELSKVINEFTLCDYAREGLQVTKASLKELLANAKTEEKKQEYKQGIERVDKQLKTITKYLQEYSFKI